MVLLLFIFLALGAAVALGVYILLRIARTKTNSGVLRGVTAYAVFTLAVVAIILIFAAWWRGTDWPIHFGWYMLVYGSLAQAPMLAVAGFRFVALLSGIDKPLSQRD